MDGSGQIDFEEFVAAAQLMPVLSLGIALFREGIDGSGGLLPDAVIATELPASLVQAMSDATLEVASCSRR